MGTDVTTTLYGITSCDTVRRARQFLTEHDVTYAFHDFKKAGVDAAMLERWCDVSGWETVLNRAGTTFRKLPEADKADLDRGKAIALMLAAPSMIKRPVLERDGEIRIGFKPEEYRALFA